MMREIIWNMWAVNTPGEKFSLERTDIMKLPWDDPEPERPEYSEKEIEEIRRRFDTFTIND
jgi:hypothetical protein